MTVNRTAQGLHGSGSWSDSPLWRTQDRAERDAPLAEDSAGEHGHPSTAPTPPSASVSASASIPSNAQIASSVALVSGTTVGAGIIALAAVSAPPGFLPSSAALVAAWMLMGCTGLLIAEVTCNCARAARVGRGDRGDAPPVDEQLGIVSTTHRLLGLRAAAAAGLVYAFIHYSLLTAYIAEAGAVLGAALHIPTYGPLLFTAVLGGAMGLGSEAFVRRMNDTFFLTVLTTFVCLVGLGLGAVRGQALLYTDAGKLGPIFPILLVALVYHNVVVRGERGGVERCR
jgi:tyrosine-specific transport protein